MGAALDLNYISPEALDALPKEELYQVYRLLSDFEQVQDAKRFENYMDTAHEAQIQFHKARNRIRFFLGGNRSGKTTAGCIELLHRLRGTHPFQSVRTPIKACIVVQDFQNHAIKVMEPKIKAWFPPGFIVKQETNHSGAVCKYTCSNGSTVDVQSHDQDIKVFESSDYDFVWFDEPPPRGIFIALWRSMVDRGGRAVITGTPIVQPWMFDEVQQARADRCRKMVWYKYVNSYENAVNLGEGSKEEGIKRLKDFEKLLTPEERTARIEGKFLHLRGIIFKTWERRVHKIEPFKWPSNWPIIYSVDPHEAKPWAVSFLGITEAKNVILIHSEKISGVISDVAERCIEIRDSIVMDTASKPRITQGWIDNAAGKPLMEKRKEDGQKITALEEFNSQVAPYLPKCKPAPKNVREKIRLFGEWLKPRDTQWGPRPKFMVFDVPENDDFVHEIEHYQWKTYTGRNRDDIREEPTKKGDDILDTIMQVALTFGPQFADSSFKEKKALKYGRR